MSLNKAIKYGKEKRKEYTGAKSIACSCRNHGSCEWCKGNRLYQQMREEEKIGDTVKVIGTTACGDGEKECIKIGTICKVVGIENDEKEGLLIGIVPERELPFNGYGEYWYLEKDVEKGHMEWAKD